MIDGNPPTMTSFSRGNNENLLLILDVVHVFTLSAFGQMAFDKMTRNRSAVSASVCFAPHSVGFHAVALPTVSSSSSYKVDD